MIPAIILYEPDWVERVKEPFRLLVFDNHTDMQLPAFGGLLSCGGWIASAIEEAENLVEVWLVGPDEEAYSQVEEPLKEKVKFFSREMLRDFRNNESYSEKTNNMERNVMDFSFLGEIPTDLPLYVSIDKDVLGTTDASTTWSQGDMTLGEMWQHWNLSPGILKRPAEKSFRWISAGNVTRTEQTMREMMRQTGNF